MKKLRVVLSLFALSLMAACAAEDVPDPVASQEDELRMVCTETYECGTPTAPRTCCRCWEWIDCPSGPWDPSCYSGICTR